MNTNDKTLYQQKQQAQLNEWQAEVDKLKAKASGASADIQLALKDQVKALEATLEKAKAKLASMVETSDDKWHTMKAEMESTWDDMKASFREAADNLTPTGAGV